MSASWLKSVEILLKDFDCVLIIFWDVVKLLMSVLALESVERVENFSKFFNLFAHVFMNFLVFIHFFVFAFNVLSNLMDDVNKIFLFIFVSIFFRFILDIFVLFKLSFSFIFVNFFIVIGRLNNLVLIEFYLWNTIALL